MKKYILSIAAILVFVAPALALADSIAVVPSSVQTGSESGVNGTQVTGDNTAIYYLFNPAGYSVNNWTGTYLTDGTHSWADMQFPTGNATGTYLVYLIDTTSELNSLCGMGQPYSTCSAAIGGPTATTTILITASGGGGGGSSTTTIGTDQAYFYDNSIFDDLFLLFISGLASGILIYALMRISPMRKKGRKEK